MDPARLARARRALSHRSTRALDAEGIDRTARALDDPDAGDDLLAAGRHGALTVFVPADVPGRRRRILELDRSDTPVAALRWSAEGALAAAAVRTGLGAWIGIEPRGAPRSPWGVADRVWLLGDDGPAWQPIEPLTAFESIDWSSITHIPPLAEPGRLPSGAGTAVLNLVAALAKDQGTPRLPYRGPFATESLFTALLESFRFDPTAPDPLRRFLSGDLDWMPAPHERHLVAPGVSVQLRERLEKVVLDGRLYYREDWQTVRRHAPRRLVDAGDEGVRCTLWALGTVIEEHAVLSRSGDLLGRVPPSSSPRPPAALPASVRDGVAAVLCARSAAALGPEIRRAMASTPLRWGPVTGDLVAADGDGLRFSWLLAEAAAVRAAGATSRADRLARGLELVAEMAALCGDAIRSRAQSALATASPEHQRAALSMPGDVPDARAIAEAADAVLSTL